MPFYAWFSHPLHVTPPYNARRGEHFSIELTYNYGVSSYEIGEGFKGMGLRLPDLEGIASRAKASGGTIVSGPEASGHHSKAY